MSRVLRVPRRRGETVRRALSRAGLLRPDQRIVAEGEDLLIPVTEDPIPTEWGTPEERAEGPGRPAKVRGYRDLLPWPRAETEGLPRAFDVVGDVVLIRLPEAWAGRSDAIGRALLGFVPGARVVGWDQGVHGTERIRRLTRIAGDGDWRTRHRENGIEFTVDLEHAYFSPRLAREHARVAREVRAGDRVYDLCCGIGPFALTIARAGRALEVTGVDVNPAAIELMRATIARSPFARGVRTAVGDLREFLASRPPVEDVVFNLPHDGIKYLPSVGTAVAPGGRLFYYEVSDREVAERRPVEIMRALGDPREWRLQDRHPVHPYSPRSDLVALTFARVPTNGEIDAARR